MTTTPKTTGRLEAPAPVPFHEPLTVAPKARLLARVYGPARALFLNCPPFAGKITPTREWERADNGALLVLAQDAADKHGLTADECAVEFTRGCEETVRYASELTDAALEAMTAHLNNARPTTCADVRVTTADELRAQIREEITRESLPIGYEIAKRLCKGRPIDPKAVEQLRAHVLATASAATTPALLDSVAQQVDVEERLERIVAICESALRSTGHDENTAALFGLIRETAGGGR